LSGGWVFVVIAADVLDRGAEVAVAPRLRPEHVLLSLLPVAGTTVSSVISASWAVETPMARPSST